MARGPYGKFRSIYCFSVAHSNYCLGVMDGEFKFWCPRTAEYYSQRQFSEILINSGVEKAPKMPKHRKRELYKERVCQRLK